MLIETEKYYCFLEHCGLRQNTYRAGHRVFEAQYLGRPVVVNDRVPFVPHVVYREHLKHISTSGLKSLNITEEYLFDWIEKHSDDS